MVSKALGRVALLTVMAAALSGCSAWQNTMSDLGLYGSQNAATTPARPAAMPAATHAEAHSNAWCRQVAAQHRQEAAENGFDTATQQRRYRVAYRQCLFLDGNSTQP